MALPVDDLSVSQALVVDSNPTSRSILVSQLRDFGMGSVVQCARLADVRRQLEYRSFDVVLCEHHFANEATSGQDFLDDKNPKNERMQRLSSIVDVLSSIEQSQFAHAVDAIRNMARTVKSPGFDFESASNQLALMAQLANKAIQLDEVESFVDTLALRFCTAYLVLHRYSDKIADASKLGEAVQELRALCLPQQSHCIGRPTASGRGLNAAQRQGSRPSGRCRGDWPGASVMRRQIVAGGARSA